MTTTTIPATFPTFDPRAAAESAEAYGLRDFRFLLEYDGLGLLDTETLRLALHASHVVVAARGISERAADRLADLRRRIISLIERDERAARQAAAAAAVPAPAPAPKGRPGRPSLLLRRQPVMPPAGGAARPF